MAYLWAEAAAIMNLAMIPKPLLAIILALPIGAYGWSKVTGQPISSLPVAVKSAASNVLGSANGGKGRGVIAGGGGGGRRLFASSIPGSPAGPTMYPTGPLTIDPSTGQVTVPSGATGTADGNASASIAPMAQSASDAAMGLTPAVASTYTQAYSPARYDQWSSDPKSVGPSPSWAPGANDTYIVNAAGATQVPYGTLPSTSGNIYAQPPVVPHGAAPL